MIGGLPGPTMVAVGVVGGWIAGRMLGRAVADRQIAKARRVSRHRAAARVPGAAGDGTGNE